MQIKNKNQKRGLSVLFILACLLIFQNCGGKFSAKPFANLASQAPTPIPQPPPQPVPIPTPTPTPQYPAAAAPIPQNSLDTTDPNYVIPASALIPDGVATVEPIPNTIDLSEMATNYLNGITNTLLPEFPYFHVPPGQVNMHGTPTSMFKGGAPNWGKSIQAMVMARRMSGYDLNDAQGTLTKQLMSTRNMIDPNVGRNLIDRGEGAWIVITGANPENQMTTAVEGLMELYKQYPSPDLRQLIQQMISYHTKMGVRDTNDQGQAQMHFRLPEPGVDPFIPNSIGTIGYGDGPFVAGKTMRALSTWFMLVNDLEALSSTMLISNFIRNFSNQLFWRVPPAFPEGAGEGHFAGHMHMYANGIMGILWEAEARLKNDPNDRVAWQLIEFVKKFYFFVRNMHNGAAVALGNFGEICMTANMLKIAVKMTELGAGDFNEDIERWTRNQIFESQIQGAITIEDHPDDPLRDRIGAKVIGLFFEDATHPLAIPDVLNDQGSLTLQLVACGLGNVIHGLYDVWEHIVQFKNNVAQVNLLMNKATWYLDVVSEIPYKGSVYVNTHGDLGQINTIDLRIPDGVNPATVQVTANGTTAAWGWIGGNYLRINAVQPNSQYRVIFPLNFKQMEIRQVRNQNQNWAESSYSPNPGSGRDYGFHENSPENIYMGTFRGNTLVSVDHRPPPGIVLYRDDYNHRAELAALGAEDFRSGTPTHASYRFRLRPK